MGDKHTHNVTSINAPSVGDRLPWVAETTCESS